MNTILACVGGTITESADGTTYTVTDAWQNKRRTLPSQLARDTLAQYRRNWPNAEYLSAIRHLLTA